MSEERVLRAYGQLLRLYPRWFRTLYGAEMEKLFADRLRGCKTRRARAALWRITLWDVGTNALLTRLPELPRSRTKVRRTMLADMYRDVRTAVRGISRAPGFAVLAIATLALGVGANGAVFGVVNGILLRPLPFPAPDALIALYETRPDIERGNFSPADYEDMAAQTRSFEQLAAYRWGGGTLTGEGAAQGVTGAQTTASFFGVLGVRPLLGRVYTSAEEQSGAQVIVLSQAFWQRMYGGDASILGRTLTLNGSPLEVIGVMPAEFSFPPQAEVWTPLLPTTDAMRRRNFHFLRVIGRLAPNATLAAAHADAAAVMERLVADYPQANANGGVHLESLQQSLVGNVAPALKVMAIGVLGLLLIACANTASLFLVRASARAREVGIRLALGAGRARVARQILTEGLVYGAVAGMFGLLIAGWSLRAMLTLAGDSLPRASSIGVTAPVVWLVAGVALLTGLVCGVAPLVYVLRGRLETELAGAARGVTGERWTRAVRSTFVTLQVALAVTLTIGAVTMLRSFAAMQRAPLGFEETPLLTFSVALPGRYAEDDGAARYADRLLSEVAAVPGVRGAAVGLTVPLHGGPWTTSVAIPGREAESEGLELQWNTVSPGFAQVLGKSIVRGRDIAASDAADGAPVALLNRSGAARVFGAADPIGASMRIGPDPAAPPVTVIGVIDDYALAPDEAPQPTVYVAFAQEPMTGFTVVVRTQDAADAAVSAPVLERAQAIDPDVLLVRAGPFSDKRAQFTHAPRFNAVLLVAFAGIALSLALVGVYGLLSYTVALRQPEIGVRLAMGASQAAVVLLVLRNAAHLVGIGVLAGVAGAWATASLLSSLVFGVGTRELGSFVLIAGAVTVAALVGALLPALRAARVDPAIALREAS